MIKKYVNRYIVIPVMRFMIFIEVHLFNNSKRNTLGNYLINKDKGRTLPEGYEDPLVIYTLTKVYLIGGTIKGKATKATFHLPRTGHTVRPEWQQGDFLPVPISISIMNRYDDTIRIRGCKDIANKERYVLHGTVSPKGFIYNWTIIRKYR